MYFAPLKIFKLSFCLEHIFTHRKTVVIVCSFFRKFVNVQLSVHAFIVAGYNVCILYIVLYLFQTRPTYIPPPPAPYRAHSNTGPSHGHADDETEEEGAMDRETPGNLSGMLYATKK